MTMGCSPSKQSDVIIQDSPKKVPEENNNEKTIAENKTNGAVLVDTKLISESVETIKLTDHHDVTKANDNNGNNTTDESLEDTNRLTSRTKNLSLSTSDGQNTRRLSVDNFSTASFQRNRTVSIITDDGYDDLEATERRAEEGVIKIYKSLKWVNSSPTELVSVIVPTHGWFRQALRRVFKDKYDEDLVKTVKRNTTGNLGRFLVHLLMDVPTYIAHLMRQYIQDCDYVLLAELLTSFNPSEINMAKESYFQVFEISFDDDVMQSLDELTPTSLKNIVIPLCSLQRKEANAELQTDSIEQEADRLSLGADEIVNVLVQMTHSRGTLGSIFKTYKLKYYLNITDSIDIEFHDETKSLLIAIVHICENSVRYFAGELLKAIGRNDKNRILDITIARHQLDLGSILQLLEETTNKSFLNHIKNLFSDTCEKALVLFLRKHAPQVVR